MLLELMHIPDGYLSPSTCAGLFGVAAPFWWVALSRIRKELTSRTIPLLAVFSAFSFVVMMFNLPLPGGTTGHAVGMGIASVTLGPWVAMAALSVALLIQALLFGDGGVTALGANCFNMAIVGSLVSYGCYRLVSRSASLVSFRRVVAAGLAGYVGINAAALCAAVEFGIQPLLFHDASGNPRYAPYPLSVSIPAMMLGHLTFAGLAELLLSAGLVRYLQRARPELLRRTAPHASPLPAERVAGDEAGFRLTWPFWTIIGLLILMSPLGILAIGGAWGEWRARDFSDPAVREQIKKASGNHALPARAPGGLEKLSGLWRAPMRDYESAFVSSAPAAYALSALLGVGAILLFWWLPRKLAVFGARGRKRRNYVARAARDFLAAASDAVLAEEIARKPGFLQRLDPRAKLVGFGALVITAVALWRIPILTMMLAGSAALAVLSRAPIRRLATRVWPGVLGFAGFGTLPALFLVPGSTLARIPWLGWTISNTGLKSAALITLRAEVTASLVFLLIASTRWNRLLRALRFLLVPATAVMILESSLRFIFLLLESGRELLESRETRLVGPLPAGDQRRLAVVGAGVLLGKSLHVSEEVHLAMQARGFRGEARLLDDLRMGHRDWQFLSILLLLSGLLIWIGR